MSCKRYPGTPWQPASWEQVAQHWSPPYENNSTLWGPSYPTRSNLNPNVNAELRANPIARELKRNGLPIGHHPGALRGV